MKWKHKVLLTRLISKLPGRMRNEVYYKLQSKFGAFKNINYEKNLLKSIRIVKMLQKQDQDAFGKTFLEVGTGWMINTPIGLWLCGAEKTITVDLNPYLKEEFVQKLVNFILDNEKLILAMFRDVSIPSDLSNKLISLQNSNKKIADLLSLMNIEYIAPGNASSLPLKEKSVDYHISVNVLEHIKEDVIISIFQEGERVLKNDGLVIHIIDPSDHFSHSDSSISKINFLQFSDKKWEREYVNKFAYHNRLRSKDYQKIFSKLGMKIIYKNEIVDQQSIDTLQYGFTTNEKFHNYTAEELSIVGLHLIGKYATHHKKNL